MEILALLTCFNRMKKTKDAIVSLVEGNKGCDFTFVVVDDDSIDGTYEMLCCLKKQYNIHLVKGKGGLYYSGGMRVAMEYAFDNLKSYYDYVLLFNDDVCFYNNCIQSLCEQSKEQNNSVIVGATCDSDGNLSYSAIKYIKGIRYRKLSIEENNINADTFNANCVLIPFSIYKKTDVIDKHYIHSLGDFDYGLSIKKSGQEIFVSRDYVGLCDTNTIENTWLDRNIKLFERIKKKESVKGAPFIQWFYYLNKNFGIFYAFIYSFTPYFRILTKK